LNAPEDRLGVKTGNVLIEQKISALPPKADIYALMSTRPTLLGVLPTFMKLDELPACTIGTCASPLLTVNFHYTLVVAPERPDTVTSFREL
jgi:hypothetical protein